MIDAVGGAGEGLIGVAFRLLLLAAGHRVQLVALTQQGHPVEVIAPEVLLGYTVARRYTQNSQNYDDEMTKRLNSKEPSAGANYCLDIN